MPARIAEARGTEKPSAREMDARRDGSEERQFGFIENAFGKWR